MHNMKQNFNVYTKVQSDLLTEKNICCKSMNS